MTQLARPARRLSGPSTAPPPEIPTEDELRRFFANALSMLCIAGFDGYFKRLNPAWAATLGWTLEELQSRPFMEYVHPGDRAATHAEMARLIRGAPTVSFENRYRRKDGSYTWLHWNANSLPARRQVYATARDLSVRKDLQKKILAMSDREKERLGRELHDGLCQNLAGITALTTSLARKLAPLCASSSQEAREIAKSLQETIGQARDMARGLNPVNLEHIGIAAALEALSSNVESLFQVSCGFLCHDPDLRLGSEVEAHLFRIAQEAVHNAISHGRARRIEISLSMRDGCGCLSIRDDGVGMDETAHTGNGTGLHTMEYRARLIGGTLQVQARSRRGTKVICTFAPAPARPPQ